MGFELVMVFIVVAATGLLAALGLMAWWALRRARERSREVNAQVERLGRGLAELRAALVAEQLERSRQDEELERRGERRREARLEESLAPLREQLGQLGEVEREAARVWQAVAEGGVEPAVGAELLRHLGELAADLATPAEPEP